MARILEVLKEAPRRCSYLEDEQATLIHRILLDVDEDELEHLLVRGWRRFGPDYFRPACPRCSACLPTRIPTATFQPSKSQRRARKACEGLYVLEQPAPVCDPERLALYNLWHAHRERERGWDDGHIDERGYRMQFSFPHPAARELTYIDPASHKIVGVALCDETPAAWSAIYFFYHPDWAAKSIGTANVVTQIELAQRRGIPHVYLGFRVDACKSLAYKAAFRPQEVLVGLPDDDEAPRWEEAPPRAP